MIIKALQHLYEYQRGLPTLRFFFCIYPSMRDAKLISIAFSFQFLLWPRCKDLWVLFSKATDPT